MASSAKQTISAQIPVELAAAVENLAIELKSFKHDDKSAFRVKCMLSSALWKKI